MTKLKIKQIDSTGGSQGAMLTIGEEGTLEWAIPDKIDLSLGTPSDGSWSDGRYEGSQPPALPLDEETKIVDAIDGLNEVLGLLMPVAPPSIVGAPVTLSTANTTAKLASGFTSNIGAGPAAGSDVIRTAVTSASSNIVQDRGDGAAGTLGVKLNGSLVSGESLTFTTATGQTKTTGVLRVADNKWTVPAGFFQTFDSSVNTLSVPVGYNEVRISHTSGDSAAMAFVRDDVTAAPVASAVTIAERTPGTLVYSSGIPHYAADAILDTSANLTNLSGQTYLGSGIITIAGSRGIGATVSAGPGSVGLPAILAANTLNFTMTNAAFTTANNQHTSGFVSVAGANPSGSGIAVNAPRTVLVKSGTAQTTQIDELNVRVVNLGTNPNAGTARRMSFAAGDTPAGNGAAWTGNTNNAIATHEAVVVGGTLAHSTANYSNYLPAGPDYSDKAAVQYAVFAFERTARSTFKINITGTYAGVWVKLPGITDTTVGANGWWDLFQSYNGAGVPGDGPGGNGSNGAALGATMTGATGEFTATFGTQSSTNATGNRILVRIRLNAGQSITSLFFTS